MFSAEMMDRPRRNIYTGFSSILRLNRTPFPSVTSYIVISFFISVTALANIMSVFKSQPAIRALLQEEILNSSLTTIYDHKSLEYLSSLTIVQVFQYIKGSSPLTWVSINTYFAFLALLAKFIIRLTFKELTRQEEATARHSFLSFLMFSVVFLSVVAGAHHSHRVLPWLIWFGVTGFMAVLHEVTYQRLKFVSTSVGSSGGRLSWLSFFLCIFSSFLILSIFKFRDHINFSHMLFLVVDSVLSLLRSLHGLLRCISSSERFAHSPDAVRHFNYWLDLSITLAIDAIQLLNYFEPYFLVCWEKLGLSRRLPCGHQFHDWCLMWWLAQDGTCPTCRRVVSAPPPINQPLSVTPSSTTTFQFGGGFGFLRLPSFSIEFSTGSSVNTFLRQAHNDSQLMGMARQVHEMFPQIAIDVITEDLRISGSSQATIDNILEGRVGFVTDAEEMHPWVNNEVTEESDLFGDDDDSSGDDVVSSSDSTFTPSPPHYSASVDSVMNQATNENLSQYQIAKRDMIAKYRRRYIESQKGQDLRKMALQN
ncbi:CUE domain protein [Dictyocaulus viviparus]|uniref:CUE domain protein n=1 Tax=Dictyocaulus viviparus TaxID=29172 RepID=A0A0D8XJC2_DICVI|nr:CUE domain protein [Dictyocaulus viviparus]